MTIEDEVCSAIDGSHSKGAFQLLGAGALRLVEPSRWASPNRAVASPRTDHDRQRAAKERACASSPPPCPAPSLPGCRRPGTSPTTSCATPPRPPTRWCSPVGPGRRSGTTSPPPQFLDEVRGVAKGLVAAGVRPGDRVALISRTRYEWTLFDYAIWFAGAVGVPVYETSSAEQVGWILRDSGACAVVAEGPLPPQPDRRGPRRPRGAAPRLVDRRQRRRRAHPAGRRRPRRRARVPAHHRDPARPGHDHLHLGHHRSSQGLHAHPRQPDDRAGSGRPRARGAVRALRKRRRLDPAVPPAGPRVRAGHPGRVP